MAYYMIHPREMDAILRSKHAMVIDVREREEFLEYHYENARNLPYDQIDNWIRRLPKNRAVIVYCDYGSTSLMAARSLSREGYEVYTVVGGMDAMQKYFGY